MAMINVDQICPNCKATFRRTRKRIFCCRRCRWEVQSKPFCSKAGRASASKQIRRSKNEILFAEKCALKFRLALNEKMFEGWDADVILLDRKVAVLWNGPWHYRQCNKKHSVLQVQTRDKLKSAAIIRSGFFPYVVKDLGKFNPDFVESEFVKFCSTLQ